MNSDTQPHVVLTREGPIATIRFNRPERRNALSFPLLSGFRDLLAEVGASDARVLVVRGEGNDFCVGADVNGGEDRKVPGFDELASFYDTGRVLHELPQITIAAIDGGCAGPGLAWACACDFRFASERAVFNTAFLNVGVPGEMGLTWSLAQVVGPAWTRELLLFPGKFDAAAAHRMGLVTRLFPNDRLHAETIAAAEVLTRHYGPALRAAKQNLLAAETLGLGAFIAIEGERHARIAAEPARLEGFRAFAEKRPPKFD